MHSAPPHRPLQIYFLWMDTMVPSKLQTDNGSEFANAILNELCDLFGVQFIHGSVGHPQSQVRTPTQQCCPQLPAMHHAHCHAATACLHLKWEDACLKLLTLDGLPFRNCRAAASGPTGCCGTRCVQTS